MSKVYLLGTMREKRIGRGEDSDPILLTSSADESLIVTGVLDGMGGAGSSECESDFSTDRENKTKAYVASRIIKEAIENFITDSFSLILSNDFSTVLKERIKSRLSDEIKKFPPKSKSILRSALIKDYPTTLALTTIHSLEDNYCINSYWAGDSRNYLWTKNGFFQISKDDLKGNPDPLENLKNDAPMSNCIHADGDFEIHNIRIDSIPVTEKIIILSATDGCFGYYPTPMDFEKVLRKTMKSSSSFEEWVIKLVREFEAVTGDDFSFAVATVGFEYFRDLKKTLSKGDYLSQNYFRLKNTRDEVINIYKKLIGKLHRKIQKEVSFIWPKYKKNYLKYLDSNE
ncbi:MAG: protein phosphatase 2C domain-containing protein [Muribaculaceae bacterium]|nr:protein phosphatase 2C domain-containing protein [Muribaculaceae bacterium]MDE6754360.1 protein phosphatase 2C domain-containing protein [Muribaculaceae bacterium]